MYFTSGSDRAFEQLMQGKPGFDHYDSGEAVTPEDCGTCRFYRPHWKYQFCVYAECPYQPGKLTAYDAVTFRVKGVENMLFMVIIILVRPIMSYNEIVSVLESSVALLAGVFMADIYYMEYMNERISTYSLFPIKQKRGSILKRAFISQLYLIVLVAVFYWGFVLVYHPTNYSGVPVISLYASCVGACAASMFFMGTFCFTATNLMRNIGLAIGLLFFFWLLLTSTIIRVLPEILQLFKLSGEVVQDGYLIPFWPSRILYVVCAVALMYWNLHLVNQQPDFNKKRWCKHGNKSM